MHNIIELNKAGYFCRNFNRSVFSSESVAHAEKTVNQTTPLMISMVRDPAGRTVSYFNYFLCRSATIPLEQMLEIEMKILVSRKMAPWLNAIKHLDIFVAGDSPTTLFEKAHIIISAHKHLLNEMEAEISVAKEAFPGMHFEAQGLLLDNVYLPQLLGILYPKDNKGEPANVSWPLMILQSEFFFANREVSEDH